MISIIEIVIWKAIVSTKRSSILCIYNNDLKYVGLQIKFVYIFPQACSEAAYNSVLNVEALKEAVRLKPSLIILKATKDGKFEYRFLYNKSVKKW